MIALRNKVDKLLIAVCIFLLAAMTALVVYQVVARYFFGSPSAISEVLARYLFVWLILICSAYVFGKKEHMNIAFLKDKLREPGRTFCNVASEIVICLFALFVLVVGGILCTGPQFVQLDSALQIPMGVFYLMIPVSGAFTVFYSITNIIQYLREEK